MPRFIMNRRWTFILTVVAFASVIAQAPSFATQDNPGDGSYESVGDGTVGAPPPQGAGDPDIPTPSTRLREQRRESLRSEGSHLSSRTAGDSRIERTVWMWRLSVMGRALRAYWFGL